MCFQQRRYNDALSIMIQGIIGKNDAGTSFLGFCAFDKAARMQTLVDSGVTDYPADLDGAMTLLSSAAQNYRTLPSRSTRISQRPRPLTPEEEW